MAYVKCNLNLASSYTCRVACTNYKLQSQYFDLNNNNSIFGTSNKQEQEGEGGQKPETDTNKISRTKKEKKRRKRYTYTVRSRSRFRLPMSYGPTALAELPNPHSLPRDEQCSEEDNPFEIVREGLKSSH